jgi:hypothetical protein
MACGGGNEYPGGKLPGDAQSVVENGEVVDAVGKVVGICAVQSPASWRYLIFKKAPRRESWHVGSPLVSFSRGGRPINVPGLCGGGAHHAARSIG